MSELYDTHASLFLNFSDTKPYRIQRVKAGKSTTLTVTARATAGVSRSDAGAAEWEVIRSDGGSVVMTGGAWKRVCDTVSIVVSVPYGLDLKLTTTSGSPAVETPACSDGVDNDGDGLTDWPMDPGYARRPFA